MFVFVLDIFAQPRFVNDYRTSYSNTIFAHSLTQAGLLPVILFICVQRSSLAFV